MSSRGDTGTIVMALKAIKKQLEAITNLLTPIDSIRMRLAEIREPPRQKE